jgi:nicotinamide-nucleotide amidase
VLYPECLAHIEALFRRWGRQISENNKRQAYLPTGSIAIANPVGTAPGFILELDEGTIIALPGVPREMERLMQDTVLPYLRARMGDEQVVIKAKVLRTVGQGESWIDERLDAQMRSPNPTVGLAAHLGAVDVRITGRGPTHEAVDAMIADMEAHVRARIGADIIFGTGDDNLETVTAALLAQAGVQLALVESATGGEVARLLRESPEGRSVVTAAHVAGDADELATLLDLSPGKMAAFGWVSAMTAAEAALQLVDTYEGGWGLAVLSEPQPESDVYGDQPGCTVMALATPDDTQVREYRFGGQGYLARRWVTLRALDLLRRAAQAKLAQGGEKR